MLNSHKVIIMSDEYITRTYDTDITFYHQGEVILKALGEVLSTVRNTDYTNLIHGAKDNKKPTRESRRSYCYEQGLNKRYADSIIKNNDAQLDLVKRTMKENIKAWEQDARRIKKSLKNNPGKKKHYLLNLLAQTESKIQKSKDKSPSCCFGGKSLLKRVTQYPYDNEAREDWHNKRLFLTFLGESGRKGGNDILQIDPDTWDITLKLTPELASLLRQDTQSIVLGRVNFKYGSRNIEHNLRNRISMSYEFSWVSSKRKWCLHASTRVNKKAHVRTYPSIHGRTCGIDQNSGFICATIIDAQGNPLTRRTFTHESSKDIGNLVHALLKWLANNYCSVIVIEDLASLHNRSRRSYGSSAGLNRVVNKIPKGEFKTRLANRCEDHGCDLRFVDPRNTSKGTIHWGEDRFGVSTHEKASYLIARRGVGLGIERRSRIGSNSPRTTRGWYEGSMLSLERPLSASRLPLTHDPRGKCSPRGSDNGVPSTIGY